MLSSLLSPNILSFADKLTFLPNDKLFDWFKFKEFTEDQINVTQISKFVLSRVENIVGKGENAGYQHFHLFP